ncbi:hypothetical protein BC830DRAFT_1094549 [Chytriomyces sp. MP71]|nr:hypothetical protein BC830DRAFT_1094549 [Chytriomyces sp. MP71]
MLSPCTFELEGGGMPVFCGAGAVAANDAITEGTGVLKAGGRGTGSWSYGRRGGNAWDKVGVQAKAFVIFCVLLVEVAVATVVTLHCGATSITRSDGMFATPRRKKAVIMRGTEV